MADPDRERSISRMSWIAFILAAIAGLLAILLGRPAPAQPNANTEITMTEITRSI